MADLQWWRKDMTVRCWSPVAGHFLSLSFSLVWKHRIPSLLQTRLEKPLLVSHNTTLCYNVLRSTCWSCDRVLHMVSLKMSKILCYILMHQWVLILCHCEKPELYINLMWLTIHFYTYTNILWDSACEYISCYFNICFFIFPIIWVQLYGNYIGWYSV